MLHARARLGQLGVAHTPGQAQHVGIAMPTDSPVESTTDDDDDRRMIDAGVTVTRRVSNADVIDGYSSHPPQTLSSTLRHRFLHPSSALHRWATVAYYSRVYRVIAALVVLITIWQIDGWIHYLTRREEPSLNSHDLARHQRLWAPRGAPDVPSMFHLDWPVQYHPMTRTERVSLYRTAPTLPYVHMVVITPTVYAWRDRITAVRKQWKRSNALFERAYRNVTTATYTTAPASPNGRPAGEPPGPGTPLIKYIFVVGCAGMTPEQIAEAERDRDEHGDLLLLPHIADLDGTRGEEDVVISSTTLKMLYGIRYAVEHYRFKDLVRGADDGYFNPVEYWRVRDTLPQERMLLGRYQYHGEVQSSLLREFYRTHRYPAYPLGMGYMMTYDLAEWVTTSTLPFSVTSPEDAIVGMWFQGLHIQLVDDERIHNVNGAFLKWSLAPCRPTDFIAHYMQADDWTHIDDQGRLQCRDASQDD